MTATTIGYQPHQHELNNYTTTHLIVSSASSPVEVINTGYLQLPKSTPNNANINVNHNHENHHYISSSGNTTTSLTTITPASRPVNVKRPVQNFGSNQQGGGQNGHKMLSSADLLRCKRKNGHVRNVGLTGTPGQPPAVVRRNERERNRVKMVNMGFHTLRQHIPNGSKSKKMSKVETLRAAVEHIRHLQAVLNGDTSSYTPYQPCTAIMPSDLKKPKLEDDQNFVPMHSPTDSISPSSMSSYESGHYHHIQSPPPTLHLTSQQLQQLHHITSQCTNYDSQASPISPTSPSKSSIASDISPPPYDNHVHYHHHPHQSQHLPLDGLDKACHPEESDIFDFASLLS